MSREILLEEKIGAGAFGSVYKGPQKHFEMHCCTERCCLL